MSAINTITACSRWNDTASEMPPVVGYTSGSASVGRINQECPRHGSTECLATYRIERRKP